jgi:hypothetical protein
MADAISVNDLFFEYERGQKLGMWVLAIDSGLLLGPTCEFDQQSALLRNLICLPSQLVAF